MMKFPSTSAEGTEPSGSSLAVTYPGVFGSRVGGVGRGGAAGVCAGGGTLPGAPAVLCAFAGRAQIATAIATQKVVCNLFMVRTCPVEWCRQFMRKCERHSRDLRRAARIGRTN